MLDRFLKSIITLSGSLLLSVIISAQSVIQPILEFDKGRITQLSIPLESLSDLNLEQVAIFTGVMDNISKRQPPILGRFKVSDTYLSFYPHFSLEGGRTFTLKINPELSYSFKTELPVESAPVLLDIFPSSNQLPSNLLKFYLHFSVPMQAGNSYVQIALIDQRGDTLDAPFVALSPELWNDDFTRLTLWLDPGRIKRDLGPNQLLGPVLQQRQTYELVIKPGWKNQQGLPLNKKYQKSFRVIQADRQKVNPDDWKLNIPKAGTSDALLINFLQPMDAALLQRMIQVLNVKNEVIPCQFQLGPNEELLKIIPLNTWKSGVYQLRIDTYLEDICGNNLLRPFDRDLHKATEIKSEEDFNFLTWEVKK
ncbi:MAG: hypothetical protein Sapg2KO_09640 [Saprospiraceae bacterium]